MKSHVAWRIGGLAIALIATIAYWPGTNGGFLFDDFANLNALGRYGGVHDTQTFLYYLTSGIADPTGRPISMLSFLIDARDWPADPFPFKRTNILLHALNGLMLAGVLTALGKHLSNDSWRVHAAALLATAFWLLHPLWASTVLYIVQRHAMLAAFFVLMGVRAWIASHDAFEAGNTRAGWTWAILAVPVCGLLAGLSKANGFLLPLLLLTLQLTILRTQGQEARCARLARQLLVVAPAVAVLTGLVALTWDAWGGNARRTYSLGERLLSQPRAVLEYLHQLFIPGLDSTGIFADGFEASTGLLTPWQTLPALSFVAVLAVAAWCLRKSQPVVSCALLFFFSGHMLESGPVMLELYFEHRNYLPAALLFWPIAWWLSAPSPRRHLRIAAGIAAIILCLMMTIAQAKLWANPLALARDWATRNPDSARAQSYAAQQEFAHDQFDSAERRLAESLSRDPDEPQFALNLLNLRCDNGTVTRGDVASVARAIAHQGVSLDMTNQWLAAVLEPGSTHSCAVLADHELEKLLAAATSYTARHAEDQARIAQLAGLQALAKFDCHNAQSAFSRRLTVQPRPEAVQSHIQLLATHCSPSMALVHIEQYLAAGSPIAKASSPALRLRDWIMRDFWTNHWHQLREVLQNQILPAPIAIPHPLDPAVSDGNSPGSLANPSHKLSPSE